MPFADFVDQALSCRTGFGDGGRLVEEDPAGDGLQLVGGDGEHLIAHCKEIAFGVRPIFLLSLVA